MSNISDAIGRVGASTNNTVSDSVTGREVAQAVDMSAEVSKMMSESYGDLDLKFKKLAEKIEKFGDSFNLLTEKVESVRQLPLVGELSGAVKSISPVAGLVTDFIFDSMDAVAKLQQKFIDLRIESIRTGAAFGLASNDVKRYADRQLSVMGDLKRSLFISQKDFDSYQKFLRTSAFGIRDLERPIMMQGREVSALKALFATASVMGDDITTELSEAEAAVTKMGQAGKTQRELLEGTARTYVEMVNLSHKLGNVSAPYIKQQMFQAISGQEASITNFETKMKSLSKAFEAFWVGLAPGERGLAGEFLEKLNKGFMDMDIGMAAWLAGPTGIGAGMGDVSEALDLLMALRSGKDENQLPALASKMKNKLEDVFQVPLDSWENVSVKAEGQASQVAAAHFAQLGMIMKQFGLQQNEAEKFMHAISVISGKSDASPEEIKQARKDAMSILSAGADVQKSQLNYLARTHRYVQGIFFHTFFKDTSESKEIKKLLGSQEDFQKEMTDTAIAKEKARLGKDWKPEMENGIRESTAPAALDAYNDIMEMANTGYAIPGKNREERMANARKEAIKKMGAGPWGVPEPSADKTEADDKTGSAGRGTPGAGANDWSKATVYDVDQALYRNIRNIRKQDIAGMNINLKRSMAGLSSEYMAKTGQKLIMTSGWRSYADQARMRALHPDSAALPGTSHHENLTGAGSTAIDLSRKQADLLDREGWFKKYGLKRPYADRPDETQHVEVDQQWWLGRQEMEKAAATAAHATTAAQSGQLTLPSGRPVSAVNTEKNKSDFERRADVVFGPPRWAWEMLRRLGNTLMEGPKEFKAEDLTFGAGQHYNGLINATDGKIGIMDNDEYVMSPGLSDSIRRMGGVMGAIGSRRLGRASAMANAAGAAVESIGAMKDVFGKATTARSKTYGVAGRISIDDPGSIGTQVGSGHTGIRSINDNMIKLTDLLRDILASTQRESYEESRHAELPSYSPATNTFDSQLSRYDNSLPSIDQSSVLARVPYRPSELQIPNIAKNEPSANQLPDIAPQAQAQSQPVFIKPNVTNRISIGNVSARVDRIAITQHSGSTESNDIPW